MKALCTVMLIVVTTASLFAQQELATSCFVYERKAVNQVKSAGDWTWFTLDGSLYRKHADSSNAEIWYKATRGSNYTKEFEGLLLDESKVAHHEVFTPANSGLPHNNKLLRIDNEGTVWFSDCRGHAASFDGIQWVFTILANARLSETWLMTPFGPDSAYPQVAREFRPADHLLRSIPSSTDARTPSGVRPPIAVYGFDIHPNGNIFIAVDNAVHVFRPLAENETKLGAPSCAAAPYPNPANSTATFAMNEGNVNKMTIDIRDLTGRLRLQNIEGVSSGTVVDVTGLEEGVYVAVIKSDGKTATTTFTVRR